MQPDFYEDCWKVIYPFLELTMNGEIGATAYTDVHGLVSVKIRVISGNDFSYSNQPS